MKLDASCVTASATSAERPRLPHSGTRWFDLTGARQGLKAAHAPSSHGTFLKSCAATLIDEATALAVPRAVALKTEMLHHQGLMADALELGESLADQHPDDQRLIGALAAAAMDDERGDVALAYTARAGDAPQGLSTLGRLMLEDEKVDEALDLFEHSLTRGPGSMRAIAIAPEQSASLRTMPRGAWLRPSAATISNSTTY